MKVEAEMYGVQDLVVVNLKTFFLLETNMKFLGSRGGYSRSNNDDDGGFRGRSVSLEKKN